jgi:hypothetical protein
VPTALFSGTPPQLVLTFTGRLRAADAVAPVVFVGEAAARPAHQRHVQVLQRADHVVAPALGVRDLRFRTDPHAFVDAGAQVLGELAVDVLVDDGAGFGRVDGHAHLRECRKGGKDAEREDGGFECFHLGLLLL